VVLLSGALLTAWWYRRSGRRVGIEGAADPALAAATGFLIIYLLLGQVPGVTSALWPLWLPDYSALLVLGVGLLALARLERSVLLGVAAAAFTGTVVWFNATSPVGVGWGLPERWTQVPSVLVPAAVLLAAGAVAGVRAGRHR
jgi:hypothetical protein